MSRIQGSLLSLHFCNETFWHFQIKHPSSRTNNKDLYKISTFLIALQPDALSLNPQRFFIIILCLKLWPSCQIYSSQSVVRKELQLVYIRARRCHICVVCSPLRKGPWVREAASWHHILVFIVFNIWNSGILAAESPTLGQNTRNLDQILRYMEEESPEKQHGVLLSNMKKFVKSDLINV